jgi:hypothetical protein
MRMRRLQVFTAALGACLLLACVSCAEPAPATSPIYLVKLRWTKAYDAETRADVNTGLLWGLSFLGADLADGARDVLVWQDDVVTLDIVRAGVAPDTLPAWRTLFGAIRDSEEYRLMGAIDIGRFLMLTLGSSRHYFALTGAQPTYAESRARYAFGGKTGAIVESGVAREQRLIEMTAAMQADDVAFVAHEGTGSIPRGTFESREFEVLDFMKNGQLRVAMYGLDGRLKDAATPALTGAGKPAKCLWCHEIRLLPAMNNRTDTAGHYTTAEFDAGIARRMALIDARRARLDSQIDFTRLQDHRYLEYLYLSFAEPTLERLAREWRIKPEEAAGRVAGKRVIHGAGEFKFLGEDRLSRADVDALGPYAPMRVPESPREPSAFEPDLLSGAHRNTSPANP